MPDGNEQYTGWDAGTMSREQIAQAAYQAGWRGEDLTKIVAIAYRESGGHFAVFVDRPSTGDWSYGLVGLNVGRPDANGQGDLWKNFYSKLPFLHAPDDLRDPVNNLKAAKALFDQSGWRPWGPYRGISETTGTDVAGAQSAVDHAASDGLLGKDYAAATGAHVDASHDAHPAVQQFLEAALAQQGDRYVFGATPSASDPDPHAFDCSSFVQWSAAHAGVKLDRTAEQQYLQLKGMGSTVSVDQALHTPGALLFHFDHEPQPGEALLGNAHVAISLGDGRAVEAIGSKYGVETVDIAKFHTGGDAYFTRAAVIPQFAATTAPLPPLPGGATGATAGTGAGAPVVVVVKDAPVEPAHEVLAPLQGSWRTTPGGHADAANPDAAHAAAPAPADAAHTTGVAPADAAHTTGGAPAGAAHVAATDVAHAADPAHPVDPGQTVAVAHVDATTALPPLPALPPDGQLASTASTAAAAGPGTAMVVGGAVAAAAPTATTATAVATPTTPAMAAVHPVDPLHPLVVPVAPAPLPGVPDASHGQDAHSLAAGAHAFAASDPAHGHGISTVAGHGSGLGDLHWWDSGSLLPAHDDHLDPHAVHDDGHGLHDGHDAHDGHSGVHAV